MAVLHDIVDLGRYPIDRPDAPALAQVIADVRRDLETDGCAVLPGFAHDRGLTQLLAEAESVAEQAHRSFGRTNVYFSRDDATLPRSHPVRQFFDRSNAFVPADNFQPGGPLRRIYEHPGFMPFIRASLDEPQDRFFRYDDPLADVIINMVEAGGGFPWHYDTNSYTVTLAIQNGDAGGAFEYAPMMRSSEDENYTGVAGILSGDLTRVQRLDLQPGDLQIFRGRYSLHRVTPVEGVRRRYVGIFSFVDTEGMCGGVERTMQLYGRVLPRHSQRAGLRQDALRD